MHAWRQIGIRAAAAWLSPFGFLCVLAGVLLALSAPQISSILGHVDRAAENTTTATGVIATASSQQATQLVYIERDVRQTAWHFDRTLGSFSKTLGSASAALEAGRAAAAAVPGTLTTLNRTADAATGLLASGKTAVDALPPLFGAAAATLNGLPPLETRASMALDNINGLLRSKAVQDMPVQADRIVYNFADMLETGNQLEQHYAQPVLHPSRNPWKRAGRAVRPYIPLSIKTASCWAVPGSCF